MHLTHKLFVYVLVILPLYEQKLFQHFLPRRTHTYTKNYWFAVLCPFAKMSVWFMSRPTFRFLLLSRGFQTVAMNSYIYFLNFFLISFESLSSTLFGFQFSVARFRSFSSVKPYSFLKGELIAKCIISHCKCKRNVVNIFQKLHK